MAERITVTMDPDLAFAVRAAAAEAGTSVSAWIGEAVAGRVRNHLLGKYLDEWEQEHGAFTAEELAEAAKTLGLDQKARGNAA